MELIFIGDKYYRESKTMMSSIYDIYWNRQDWGKVQIALNEGHSVHIRPATDDELEFANKKFKAYQNSSPIEQGVRLKKGEIKIGVKTRIKHGAIVGQDFSFYEWQNKSIVFAITCIRKRENKRLECQLTAPGYGEMTTNNYGNGCVYVDSKNLLKA